MKGEVAYLVGKDVEVVANGVIYRGKLMEIGMEEVYLKAEMGWITLMTADIDEIREKGAPARN